MRKYTGKKDIRKHGQEKYFNEYIFYYPNSSIVKKNTEKILLYLVIWRPSMTLLNIDKRSLASPLPSYAACAIFDLLSL